MIKKFIAENKITLLFFALGSIALGLKELGRSSGYAIGETAAGTMGFVLILIGFVIFIRNNVLKDK